MRFYLLEKFINLYDGYRRTFKIDQHQLLLLQENGERYLIESLCPHRGHPLETADVHNDVLRCPLHGYEFMLDSGRVRATTEAPCRALRRYELVTRDTDLGVVL
ncbi:MAG TPA: Rieske (2Fe-2S) protein [Spongiibacteraceae bacterium]|jgi:nitrite reductase/ring-hydroxylating ferredoxin subunit